MVLTCGSTVKISWNLFDPYRKLLANLVAKINISLVVWEVVVMIYLISHDNYLRLVNIYMYDPRD